MTGQTPMGMQVHAGWPDSWLAAGRIDVLETQEVQA